VQQRHLACEEDILLTGKGRIMRTIIIGVVVLLAASAPATVPAMIGEHVAMAFGPVELSYDRSASFEIDLDTGCLANQCRIFELRVGQPGSEKYSVGF
jgi:hypothetical protein